MVETPPEQKSQLETNYSPANTHSIWLERALDKVGTVSAFGGATLSALITGIVASHGKWYPFVESAKELVIQSSQKGISVEMIQQGLQVAAQHPNETAAIGALIATATFFGVGTVRVLASEIRHGQ